MGSCRWPEAPQRGPCHRVSPWEEWPRATADAPALRPGLAASPDGDRRVKWFAHQGRVGNFLPISPAVLKHQHQTLPGSS